jgi:hypothetical protein
MNVKTEALAFRIWAFAHPKDWDCTIHEIADVIRESPQRIAAICRVKNWTERLRSSGPAFRDTKYDTNETWNSTDPLIGEEAIVD